MRTPNRQGAVAAIALLSGSFLLLHGLNRLTGDVVFLRIGEQSLWTWVTSMLFAASALSALAFIALRRPAMRWPWVLVAGLMLALSVDEVATVHEQVEDEGGSDLSLFVLQPLLALAAVALLLRLRPALDRDGRIWIVLAAGALVVAQAGSVVDAKAELAHLLDVGWDVAEELLEMLVPAFVLAATLPAVWPRVAAAFDPRDADFAQVDGLEPAAPEQLRPHRRSRG